MTPPHKKKILLDSKYGDDNDTSKRMRLSDNNYYAYNIINRNKFDSDHQQNRINHQSTSNTYYTNHTEMYFFKNDGYSDFSLKRCRSFFKNYVSENDPDTIGPEGIEKLCSDLHVKPEDIVILALSWKLNAKVMGVYTLDEWIHGMTELRCDSIGKLRNKLSQLRYCLDDQVDFRSIYRYSFDFAKDNDQRCIDIETSKQILTLLLQARWPLFNLFLEFLNQSKYKVMNKDQYYNILDFSRSVDSDLKNYDENSAWPVLMDEFVEWCRATKGFEKCPNPNETNNGDDDQYDRGYY